MLIWSNTTHRTIVTKDARFNELFLNIKNLHSIVSPCSTNNTWTQSAINDDYGSDAFIDDINKHTTVDSIEGISASPKSNNNNEAMCSDNLTFYSSLPRSSRVSKPPDRFDALLPSHCLMGRAEDLTIMEKEVRVIHANKRTAAMNEKVTTREKMRTWKAAKLQQGKRPTTKS